MNKWFFTTSTECFYPVCGLIFYSDHFALHKIMNKRKKINKQRKLAQKRARQYIESLDADKVKIILTMDNYQQVGFTVQSILKVCQSSLFAHETNSEYHEFLDIVNLLDLACQLVPMGKLEGLDI